MHGKPAMSEFHRDGGGHGGLADAALAHRHDEAVPVFAISSTSVGERRRVERRGCVRALG